MPTLASASTSTMTVDRLIVHMRIAAMQWRVEHPSFWMLAFSRLQELEKDVGLQQAAHLLIIMSHLRLVRSDLVHAFALRLAQADIEDLLDLKESELISVVEAACKIQLPVALTPVLRVLVGRVHRVSPKDLIGLVRMLHPFLSFEALAFVDAALRSLIEREILPAEELSAAAQAVAFFFEKNAYQKEARSGVELFFQHCTRRALEEPRQFSPYLPSLVRSARQLGHLTPALCRLQECTEIDSHAGNFVDDQQ